MSLTTRPATQSDLTTLLQFEQGIMAVERPYDHTLKPDPISYYDISELIESPNALVIVAELDGELIGSAYATKKRSLDYVQSEFHAFLGFMYVSPQHRGKGVNQVILKDLLNWSREMNLPEVHLTVYPGNEPAIKAYEKAGFRPYITEMRLHLDE